MSASPGLTATEIQCLGNSEEEAGADDWPCPCGPAVDHKLPCTTSSVLVHSISGVCRLGLDHHSDSGRVEPVE